MAISANRLDVTTIRADFPILKRLMRGGNPALSPSQGRCRPHGAHRTRRR